jgi:hypothetical protein
MGDVTAEIAASLLLTAGLNHQVFEPGEVAADLTSRVMTNDTLDDLLTGTPGLDPTAFDPCWHA